MAEHYFTLDNSAWGLALTYNLIGRVKTLYKGTQVKEASNYYNKSIEKFKEIDHYRGICSTLEELYILKFK